MIEPQSDVRLLNINIDSTQKNQLYFANTTDQYNYMNSKVIINYNDDFTYIRNEGVIRVENNVDELYNCNYVMFKNTGFSDKWFYAFITRREYINQNRSNIYIEIDPWQTWFSSITLLPSFVEREHVTDDTIGLHTIPEGLETGDYINSEASINAEIGPSHVVIATTYMWDEEDRGTYGATYNGVTSGAFYYVCDDSQSVKSSSDIIFVHETAGKTDAIVGIFMVPDSLSGFSDSSIPWEYTRTAGGLSYGPYKKVPQSLIAILMKEININKPYTNINGYTPRNNKLYTFPYIYLLATNNNGATAEYRYEFSSDSQVKFKIKGAITPGCSIRCLPQNYLNDTENNLEGLIGPKFPLGSWNTEVYANWMAQNSLNVATSIGSSLLQVGGGIGLISSGAGAGAGASSILSGALGISSSLGQIYQHKMQPDQIGGNINSGDITYSLGKSDFTFYKMSIKQEYAKIIDDYFTMFGYKVNKLKVPNISSRSNWNFIKTIDVNIKGSIPQEEIVKIKGIFDNGCTFWKNGNNVGNYSLSNV